MIHLVIVLPNIQYVLPKLINVGYLFFFSFSFQPGPIPGMRPPMGAGAMHQPQAKGNQSVGILMPLYTIGIVIFFGYTIVKVGVKFLEK